MKILFVPTICPSKQGDLLELTILHGLRTILGNRCIDYPRKKIMYHDFSDTPKNTLHGKGFSLLTYPILDLSEQERVIENIDVVLYGSGHMYGEGRLPELKGLTKNIWVLDGHDLYGQAPRKILYENEEIIGTQYMNCFKREYIEELECTYPTGFGIPIHRIKPINLSIKTQMYQKTAPDAAVFKLVNDLGGGDKHYKFDSEEEYYNDLQKSWFGLTCKRGGWDCLRHYEIIAAGAVLLFRDFKKKPVLCSPQCLPCLSYSSIDELNSIMTKLVVNGQPTSEYMYYLTQQRKWLYNVGTTDARAFNIIQILNNKIKT